MGRELGSALSVALQPIIAHACQPTFKSRAGHHAELFAPRVDDLISGIIQVLKSGGRWIDGAGGLWSAQKLYNRFLRWRAKVVWVNIFHALATAGGPPAQVARP